MTQFIHKTNNTTSSSPSSSEIQQGEICLNTANIDSPSNGVNNGRIYIKTNAGEIRRFISLGLPSSSDPALKVKYGGTNNTFGDLTTANTDGGDSVLIIKRDSNGNHIINRTPTNKLTWDSGNNRLNINRSSPALTALHVGGEATIDTINDRTTGFDSNFYLLGSYNPGTTNNLRKILSTNFGAYFNDASIPVSKLSGTITTNDNSIPSAKISGQISLEKGGTGANLSSALGSDNGSIVYFSGTTLTYNSNFKWDNPNSTFVLNGAFNFNPPNDALNNAAPIGVDGTNKIVRMNYSYNQDLNIDDDVTFNTLTLDNGANDIGVLTVNNMQTDGSPYNAVPIGVDSSDRIVKMYYTYDQNLNTTSTVDFEKININGGTGAGDTLVITNIQSTTGGSALEIDAGGNVYKASSTRRLKENISDYPKGLDAVLNLNPKYFNMINDPNKTLRAGLIAEDLADLGLDEFVTKDADDNPSGISYDKLVILLINAIKELKNRIDNKS